MKNLLKTGALLFALLVAGAFAACTHSEGGWIAPPPMPGAGKDNAKLYGTWNPTGGGTVTLSFSNTGVSITVQGQQPNTGTYTLDGTSLVLTSGGTSYPGTATIGNNLVLSGFTVDLLNGTYTKQQNP
ncbi:MAG: hypothetical protein LBD86_04725 [Spirochaetaceae bacterium]|jgi:hypothetical protein|nr:hypothetical protein [Spirochaetaceae bacterium]